MKTPCDGCLFAYNVVRCAPCVMRPLPNTICCVCGKGFRPEEKVLMSMQFKGNVAEKTLYACEECRQGLEEKVEEYGGTLIVPQ